MLRALHPGGWTPHAKEEQLAAIPSIEKDGKAVYTRRLKPELAPRVGQKIFKRRIGKQSTTGSLLAA